MKLSPLRFHSLLQLFLRVPLSLHSSASPHLLTLTMPTATMIARGGDAKILHTTKASSRTSSLQKSTTSSSTSSSSGGNGDAGGSVGEGSRGDGCSTMIVAPPSSSSPRLRQYTHPGCSKQAQQGGVCCRYGARKSR